MHKYQAKVIAEVQAAINCLGVDKQAVCTKHPWQMSYEEFKYVFAMDAVILCDFDTRRDGRFKRIKWQRLVMQSYLQTLNEAMADAKPIPLRYVADHKSILDRKKLIKYLVSLGLDRRKLSRMKDEQIDSFTSQILLSSHQHD